MHSITFVSIVCIKMQISWPISIYWNICTNYVPFTSNKMLKLNTISIKIAAAVAATVLCSILILCAMVMIYGQVYWFTLVCQLNTCSLFIILKDLFSIIATSATRRNFLIRDFIIIHFALFRYTDNFRIDCIKTTPRTIHTHTHTHRQTISSYRNCNTAYFV